MKNLVGSSSYIHLRVCGCVYGFQVTASEAESFNSELGAILEQYVSPLPKEEALKEAAARAAAAKQVREPWLGGT